MEALDTLVELVAILTRQAARVQSAGLKEDGFAELSFRQIYILDTITRLGNPTPTELAQALEITKPSISAAVDKFERMGLISKVDSDDDRRSYHLHLTEKGGRVAEFHERFHRHLARQLIEALSPDEGGQFLSLVRKIAAHLTP